MPVGVITCSVIIVSIINAENKTVIIRFTLFAFLVPLINLKDEEILFKSAADLSVYTTLFCGCSRFKYLAFSFSNFSL